MPSIGHIYILTNPRVHGVVKIGRTNDLVRRVAELNAHAGIAGRWVVAGHVVADDIEQLEYAVHDFLRQVRDAESGGTEMFLCTPEEAGVAVLRVAAERSIKIYEDILPRMTQADIEKKEHARGLERFLVQRGLIEK